mgnify:CR=1 FL=1
MKIDFKTLKPVRGGTIKMEDPIRFPKVIVPLEQEMKDTYTVQLNKMVVDLTKLMTSFKTGK